MHVPAQVTWGSVKRLDHFSVFNTTFGGRLVHSYLEFFSDFFFFFSDFFSDLTIFQCSTQLSEGGWFIHT